MTTAKIGYVSRLTHTHREGPGSEPVIMVVTNLPSGGNNSFYISTKDKAGNPVDHTQMKEGDEIVFDKQSFLQKVVIWNGRKFKQRGYSFDINSPSLYTG